MQFIDTHIHLQDYKSINATDILLQALKTGCTKLLCVSAVETDWEKVSVYHASNPQLVVPAFGLHPWFLGTIKSNSLSKLEEYIQKHPQALIGECGLDKLKDQNIERQKQVFAQHLNLSRKYNRPLIIHSVKSQDLMEDFWKLLPDKFVFHSYNGKPDFLKKIIKQGGYIGLSASILNNPYLADILNLIPDNKLLLETDGPYQSLHKSQEAMPWFIAEQIQYLEKIAKRPLAEQIYQNSLEFIKC